MIEKHTAKTKGHSSILSKPSLEYGMDTTTVDNQDPDYHYCYQVFDPESGMVPNGYEVVNINETNEKPRGFSEKMRIKDGKVYLADTILCRIPKGVMEEREAARKWRQGKILSGLKKDNKKIFDNIDRGENLVKVDQDLQITKNT